MNHNRRGSYQDMADIIYAEKPDLKVKLNNGAQLAIDTMRDSLPSDVTDEDLEVIFTLVSFIAADLLTTPGHDISAKIDVLFDTYSLAAGACAGEIDLGDTTEARDFRTLVKEAQEHASELVDGAPIPGQYL